MSTKYSIIKKVDTKKVELSIPVTNNPKILSLIVQMQTNAYEAKQKSLSASLIGELTELFGKHNKTFTSEYRSKIWVLQYGKMVFNIFTAKGKGTSIEVCNCDYEQIKSKDVEKYIVLFLKAFNLLLTKHSGKIS